MKLIFLDLDGTLLRSDKTVSDHTCKILKRCQEAGHLIVFSTARGETNVLTFVNQVRPDAVISSGGAMVRLHGEVVYQCAFTAEETRSILRAAWMYAGDDCHITLDAPEAHYANFIDPDREKLQWGIVNQTTFRDWDGKALKISVETDHDMKAKKIAEAVKGCDCIRFSDGQWYKFTLEKATKEAAIAFLTQYLSVNMADTMAFGDDFSDIGMLRMCGCSVAMANAIPEVKKTAKAMTESNDCDGVARYLEKHVLAEESSARE